MNFPILGFLHKYSCQVYSCACGIINLSSIDNASIVDVSSPTNENFLDQIKMDRSVAKKINDWVDTMMASVVNCIYDFLKLKCNLFFPVGG